jgi:uncharacterized protein
MFRVNLVDLDRSGTQEIEGEIPGDSEFWEDLDLVLVEPLGITLVVTGIPGGQVLARGEMKAVVAKECRRCLEPLEVEVKESLDLVWLDPNEFGDAEDGEFRLVEATATELDLAPVLREEFLLAVPRFALCREDCKGLCPRCGVNWNIENCDCTLEEPDPRWEALRTMKNE